MVSGPDLGGGYLYQLSQDREDDRTHFTYHAQEGGADANGPPKGTLEPFGWSHPPTPCMFGGRGCWERRFDLPVTRVTEIRLAYNRMRFVMAALLGQVYDHEAPTLEAALEEFLDRAGRELERHHLPWRVGGSVSAWLQGAALTPRDIDLAATAEGVELIGGQLHEYLTEPVAATHWPPGREVVGGRAFVGTLVKGCRVEWATPRGDEPAEGLAREWLVGDAEEPERRVEWKGHRVPVAPIEFPLVRAFVQGDSERGLAIATTAREVGVDFARLTRVLEGSGLSTEQRDRVLALVQLPP
jgi:hypothetical protein